MTNRKDAVENILTLHRACPEAIEWGRKYDTLDELWQACEKPGWMLWSLDTFAYPHLRGLRLFAVACGQRVGPIWDDRDGRRVIDEMTAAALSDTKDSARGDAYQSIRKAAQSVANGPNYSEAIAATAATLLAALADKPLQAAVGASEQALRAATWSLTWPMSIEEESRWQADELRRILGDDVYPWLESIRQKTRGKLPML